MAQNPNKPAFGGDKPMAGLESAAEAAGQSHATDVLSETCKHLEESLEELKVKYEMYFLGVERMEPARRRDDLKRDIARLKTAFTRNTGLRFRIQSLHARYLSYERMWIRAARQKEEGTYRRDLFKARLRAQGRLGPAPAGPGMRPVAAAEDVDLTDLAPEPAGRSRPPTAPAAKAGAAKAGAAKGRAPSAASARSDDGARALPGGLDEAQMRSLYDAYITAKKRCKEDTSRLSYETVARSVNKQIPELMQRFQAKAVDFKVVIKEGRAILKAVPRT